MDYDNIDELYILTIKVKDLNNRYDYDLNEGNNECIIYTNVCKQDEYCYIDVPDHGPYYIEIDIETVINIISSTVSWYFDKQELDNQEYDYMVRLYRLTMNEVNDILEEIFDALKEEYQRCQNI